MIMESSGIAATFRTTTLEVDLSCGAVRFGYELIAEDGTALQFVERLFFDFAVDRLDASRRFGFLSSLPLLHALLGVSYFKTRMPPVVDLSASRLTTAEVALVQASYTDGLAELAYSNDIATLWATRFVVGSAPVATAAPGVAGVGSLVAFGGGRDSIVCWEALRGHRDPTSLVIVNPTPAIMRAARATGAPTVSVRRLLDGQLRDRSVARFQGHVPITVLNSAIAVAVARLHRYRYVVMSNEASASSPNLRWNGRDVNHQWAKSVGAERLVAAAIGSRGGSSLTYFSLLRPLNEFQIAARFAGHPQYLDAFMSCNYGVRASADELGWCCACDKCRFVYLSLAPFVSRHRLQTAFGRDLLDDPEQIDGYLKLAGEDGAKPFDCVGEPGEVRTCLAYLGRHPEWRDAQVVRSMATIAARWPGVEPLDILLQHVGTATAPPGLARLVGIPETRGERDTS